MYGNYEQITERCSCAAAAAPPMGVHVVYHSSITAFPLSLPPPANPTPHKPNSSDNNISTSRWHFSANSSRSGRSRWDSNSEKTIRTDRFSFDVEGDFFADDEDEGFGFGSAAKKRVWWSDDEIEDGDVDEDIDDDFGLWGDSISFDSIFKVFRAFGWMVPAIGISMLLGTGPNAFIMALVLPLAQSALSLVVDTLWGRSSNSPRSKPRARKRPFPRDASDAGMSSAEHETDKRRGSYQPRTAVDEDSVKNGERRKTNFGGWDELDKRASSPNAFTTEPIQYTTESRQQKSGKLGRRVRKREKPLLLRLLIAIFPFLGSWTKLL